MKFIKMSLYRSCEKQESDGEVAEKNNNLIEKTFYIFQHIMDNAKVTSTASMRMDLWSILRGRFCKKETDWWEGVVCGKKIKMKGSEEIENT